MHIQELKETFQKKFQALGKKFIKNHQSQIFLSKHTKLVDSSLIKLWESRNLKGELCLVAVGGYGRSELFPYSDVDILVLSNNKLTEDETERVSGFITDCWDLGLKIGHSVRNICEAREEFHKDITTATNLIENRLVTGNPIIFKKLLSLIDRELSVDNFYIDKIKEQANRHKKYKDSAYQLEPNIKESPGGERYNTLLNGKLLEKFMKFYFLYAINIYIDIVNKDETDLQAEISSSSNVLNDDVVESMMSGRNICLLYTSDAADE